VGGWRYWLGISILGLSLALPLVALIVLPLLGPPEGVNAALFALSVAGGPDALLIVAAAVMGRENLDRVLGRLAGWIKRAMRWDQVGRTRYLIGLWLLVAALLLPIVVALFFEDSVAGADGTPGWAYYVIVSSYFVFAAVFLVMGAPLWDRIRALARWDAKISFPDAGAKA
jgi:hypothetical protein